MANLLTVEKWFIKKNKDIASSTLEGNYKLQKLLYYAQAMMLCKFDTALFPNEIEGWKDGPVVAQANYYYNITRLPEKMYNVEIEEVEDRLDDDEIKVMEIINFVYGRQSAQNLIDQTHKEDPWKNVEEEAMTKKNPIITKDSIEEFYKESLVDIYNLYKDTDFSQYATIEFNSNKFLFNKVETSLSDDDKAKLFEIGSKINNKSLFVYKDDNELVVY